MRTEQYRDLVELVHDGDKVRLARGACNTGFAIELLEALGKSLHHEEYAKFAAGRALADMGE